MKPFLRKGDLRDALVTGFVLLAIIAVLAFVLENVDFTRVAQASADGANETKRAVKAAGRIAGAALQGVSDWWARD